MGAVLQAMVVNHPSPDVPFTRIVEHLGLHHDRGLELFAAVLA